MCKRLVRLTLASTLLVGIGLGTLMHLSIDESAHAQDELVVLIEELAGSGVFGDATLIDHGDGTITVDVLVTGAIGGHPIHVHSGTCESLGDIVFPLVDVGAGGGSVTEIVASLTDLLAMSPLAIAVHLSAEEVGTYIACGDIGEAVQADELPSAQPVDDATTNEVQSDDFLYHASSDEDFSSWQADFWIHAGDMLSTEASSQTYILAPFDLGQLSSYVLEAEIRLGGSFNEFEPPCQSYFGFMVALINPAEGVFAGTDQLGPPEQGCQSRYATWTPWIDEVGTIDAASGAVPPDTEWHTYRLEVEQSQIILLIDGVEVFRSTDDRYAVPGQVGIVSGNLSLEMRSFRIQQLPTAGEAAPIGGQTTPGEPLPTAIVVAIDEPSDADDWNRYVNDAIRLTLSYPSDWTVIETDDRFFVQFLPPGADPEAPSEAISIFFAPTLPYRSDDELSGVSDPEVFVVSGITGRVYQDASDDLPVQSTYVEIPHQGGTLLFSAMLGPDVELQAIFDQLLATVVVQEGE
jgi:hypothetical protein